MRFPSIARLAAIGFAFLATAAAAQAQTVLSDDTFLDSDWGIENFATPNPQSNQAELQEMTDGNPGSFRRITSVLFGPGDPSQTTRLYGFHFKTPLFVLSGTNGITSIDYREDARDINGGSVTQEFVAPALRQGGRIYTLDPSARLQIFSSWTTHNFPSLTLDSFGQFNQVTFEVNLASKPNFSPAGEPIGFGFLRFVEGPVPAGTFNEESGIDNWRVSINLGSAPPTPTNTPLPTSTFPPTAACGDRCSGCSISALVCLIACKNFGETLRDEAELITATFFKVRDALLAPTSNGERYVQIYNTHNTELLTLIRNDSAFQAKAGAMLFAVQPAFEALVNGKGGDVAITAQMVQAIDDLIAEILAKGSAALQADITFVRNDLGAPLSQYVGMTMTQARAATVGDGLIFPRISGPARKVLLLNSGSSEAQASASFYDANGALVNTLQPSVPAGGRVSLDLPSAGFEGALKVQASQPLHALAVDPGRQGPAKSLIPAAGNSTDLSFPIFERIGKRAGLVTVVNSNSATAIPVNFSFYNRAGVSLGTITSTLAPLSSTAFDAAAILGGQNTSASARITTDDSAVSASERLSPSGGAVVNALGDSDAGTMLHLPSFRQAGKRSKLGSSSRLAVLNRGDQQTQLTVSLFTKSGRLRSSETATIAPNGTYLLDARAAKRSFDGYLEVTQNGDEPLAGQSIESDRRGARAVVINALSNAQLANNWLCPALARAKSAATTSQIEVLNIADAAVEITISLKDAAGATKASRAFSLPANTLRIFRLSSKDFSQAGTQFEGSATVTSAAGSALAVTVHNGPSGRSTTGYNCAPLS